MKNFFGKITLLSIVFGAFLNANEFPQELQKVMQDIPKAKYHKDEIFWFGDTQLVIPLYGIFDEEKRKKASLTDNNKTYQAKLAKLKQNNENFCEIFFDDLMKFENIEIKKPVVKDVPYYDEKFKEAMGSCYFMGMDWFFNDFGKDGMVRYTPELRDFIKPISYTLYETNFLGENNLFLIQNYLDPEYKEIYQTSYILNEKECKGAIGKDKFSILSDRKIIRDQDRGLYVNEEDSEYYANLINYKGQDYILFIQGFFKEKKISLQKDFINMARQHSPKAIKCKRRYYYKEKRSW